MEGFTSVVHQFLPQILEHPTSCLINVNNTLAPSKSLKSADQGKLYYDSTVLFKSNFTLSLAQALKSKGLRALNVNTDFQSFSQEKSHRLCQKTFDYMGLETQLNL